MIAATDYSILNISQLLVIENSWVMLAYIDIQNSVTLIIIDSRMTSTVAPNGFFIYAQNNCSIYISKSLFGDGNSNWAMTNIFGILNYSSLEVSYCSFENGDYSYSRLLTVSDNSIAKFTNRSFFKTNGFAVAHNS